MDPCQALEEQFFGFVTVGERGQVVIPAEARRRFNFKAGDKLLVLGHPPAGGVLICRADTIRDFLGHFVEKLVSAEKGFLAGEESVEDM